MIRLDRKRKNGADICIEPSHGWKDTAAEKTKIINELIDRERRKLRSDEVDKIYRDRRVRRAFEELFYGKCSYCETKTIRFYLKIEHFRPKAEVTEDPDHFGYYWLAYEWNNLYISCDTCNVAHKDKQTGILKGKGNQFPLAQGSIRAYSPNDNIVNEKRLLIDPCEDNPEDIITFSSDGKAVAIGKDPGGPVSIDVYDLNDEKIVSARMETIHLYTKTMSDLVNYLDNLERARKDNDEAKRDKYEKKVREKCNDLNCMVSDQSPYAAVSRAIRKQPRTYGITLEDMA